MAGPGLGIEHLMQAKCQSLSMIRQRLLLSQLKARFCQQGPVPVHKARHPFHMVLLLGLGALLTSSGSKSKLVPSAEAVVTPN